MSRWSFKKTIGGFFNIGRRLNSTARTCSPSQSGRIAFTFYDDTAEHGKDIKPDVNASEIKIGDTVMLKGGLHYVSSTASNPTGGTRSARLAKVINIAQSAPHHFALQDVDGGSNVFSWVDRDLVEAVGE